MVPVSIPFTPRVEAATDLVLVDWVSLARRLTQDILSGTAFHSGPADPFRGKGRTQRVSRSICAEDLSCGVTLAKHLGLPADIQRVPQR